MKTQDSIRAVCLDVGGTLIEPWPSVGHIYSETAADFHGIDFNPKVVNARFAKAWRKRANFQHSKSDWARLVDETFDGLTPTPPSRSFFPRLYDRFAQPECWRIFDDVRPALDALASGPAALAILSNWDERLRPLLAALQLDHFFDTVIVSCEVGFTKPSPVIFEQAVRKLGLPPNHVLHVGDSLEEDVRPAAAAGFVSIHLDRRAPASTPNTIRSLHELPACLGLPG